MYKYFKQKSASKFFLVFETNFVKGMVLEEKMRKPAAIFVIAAFSTFFISCKKLIEIPQPNSTITTEKIFTSIDIAAQAISGLYYSMANGRDPNLTIGGMTVYTGLSSDELVLYSLTNTNALEFYQNSLSPFNVQLLPRLWSTPFTNIYQANAIIEGLQNSSYVSDPVRSEFASEARFVRAFLNFNLTNLYGDIPYLTSTSWRENNLLSRLPVAQVYQNIVNDLKDAQNHLAEDFSLGKGERIVPNRWTATALLARVYLYLEDWDNAETQATQIINSPLFSLASLDNVFKANNSEAIWQLQHDNTTFTGTATTEGWTIIPINNQPLAYISSQLLNTFEPDDKRKDSWINSRLINGINYHYPFKYKVGRVESVFGGTYSEYNTVFRLAEQYLIRAEARVHQAKLAEAISDLNIIRSRAGLPNYSGPTDNKDSVMEAIMHENQVEFFAEWGHRWLDLKRWRKIDEVLAPIKGSNWAITDKLYPIPNSELQTAPNIVQNRGY